MCASLIISAITLNRNSSHPHTIISLGTRSQWQTCLIILQVPQVRQVGYLIMFSLFVYTNHIIYSNMWYHEHGYHDLLIRIIYLLIRKYDFTNRKWFDNIKRDLQNEDICF